MSGENLMFVSEGSLPWSFCIVNLKIVSHGDLNAVEIWCEGLEMTWLGYVWESSLLGIL